jgi:hypothetical protein
LGQPTSAGDSVFRELVACLVVMLGVQLARLIAVMFSVEVVGSGDMRVVRGLLVVPGRMRLGRGVVVPCRMLMVSCGALVMLDLFLVRHVICC